MKGEDGTEIHCRWCGGMKAGEVFCCSKETCPYVFCVYCIQNNFSSNLVHEIKRNDGWTCFICDEDALKLHRAQHWALKKFIQKQSEKCHPLKNHKTKVPVPQTIKSSTKSGKQSSLKIKNGRKSKASSTYTPLKYRIIKGKFIKVMQNTSASSAQRNIINTPPVTANPALSKIPASPLSTNCSNFISRPSDVTQTRMMEKAKLKVQDALKAFLYAVKEITDWPIFTQASNLKEIYAYIEFSFSDAFKIVKEENLKFGYEHDSESTITDKKDEMLKRDHQDSATNVLSFYENIAPISIDDEIFLDSKPNESQSKTLPFAPRFIKVCKTL